MLGIGIGLALPKLLAQPVGTGGSLSLDTELENTLLRSYAFDRMPAGERLVGFSIEDLAGGKTIRLEQPGLVLQNYINGNNRIGELAVEREVTERAIVGPNGEPWFQFVNEMACLVRPLTKTVTGTVVNCGTHTNATLTTTGNFTTSNVVAGMPVSGTGIPAGTTVLSVESSTSLTLSAAATATATITATFTSITTFAGIELGSMNVDGAFPSAPSAAVAQLRYNFGLDRWELVAAPGDGTTAAQVTVVTGAPYSFSALAAARLKLRYDPALQIITGTVNGVAATIAVQAKLPKFRTLSSGTGLVWGVFAATGAAPGTGLALSAMFAAAHCKTYNVLATPATLWY